MRHHHSMSALLVLLISLSLQVKDEVLHLEDFFFTLKKGRRLSTQFNMADEVEPPLDDSTYHYLLDDEVLVQTLPRLRLRSASTDGQDCEFDLVSTSINRRAGQLRAPGPSSHEATWRKLSPDKTDVMISLLAPREDELQELADMDLETVSSVLEGGVSSPRTGQTLSPTDILGSPLSQDWDEEEIRCGSDLLFPLDLKEQSGIKLAEKSLPWDEEDDEAKSLLKDAYSSCVREELRQTIKYKRHLKGKGDVVMEEKVHRETISYEAIKKRHEQREKNKMYAKLSRDRALEKFSTLKKEHKELRHKSQSLVADINRLQVQQQRLERVIRKHSASCTAPSCCVGELSTKYDEIKLSNTEKIFPETHCVPLKREKPRHLDAESFKRSRTIPHLSNESCTFTPVNSFSLVF